MVVVGLLFLGQFHVPAGIDFVGQIKAFFLGHTKGKVVQFLLQFIQPAVANNLLERVGCQLAFYKDRVPRLEGVVTAGIEAVRAKEFALGVQVKRTLGNGGAGGNAAIPRFLANMHNALGALGRVRLDRGAFVDSHEAFGDPQKQLGKGRAFLRAERLDVHDQDAHRVHRIHHGIHLCFLCLARGGRPTGNGPRNVVRQVLG